ncbi:membrane-bound lytic murein transglycosylase MltF [Thalassotalea ponticola]|uniref:membrane-bound lytic murein transglycosylase MltF n=1 Tax=Thalassotalea ponticola TaxID=1523392 RepID=UPI0025B43374|nr:membrane-bound lytic murein transglycosylase MltF [Thalassotalea ponticola]MDN3652091.1 membrane-bound lytic murein transglycosylase MltF [Thalassotalea ponticola]
MKKIINIIQNVGQFRSLFLVFLLTLITGCKQSTSETSLDNILERKQVNVGTLFGPNSYYIGAKGAQGFEYELAKSYAQSLGVELNIVPTYSLDELFSKLEQGEVDILAAGLAVTEQRRKRFRFAPSYKNVSQKLVFKQGRAWPRSIEDVDAPITVVKHSSHEENLQQLQRQYANLDVASTDVFDSDELLAQVIEGRIDFTVADSHSLALKRRYYPELSVAFTIDTAKPIAWAISQNSDDALLASLVEFFGDRHTNGMILALDDKYYGHVQDFNYVDTRAFIGAIEHKLPQYAHLFQRYSKSIDWRLLAALSYQESHWNPHARSYTGVRGMMMLTLPTAKQMGVVNRLDSEQSIRGGAQYLARLMARVPARIQDPDRRWFALAAYNIGWGHLEDARRLTEQQGGDPDRWIDVKERLVLLQQRKYYQHTRYGFARGSEAVDYVENIRAYYDTLVYMAQKSRLFDTESKVVNSDVSAAP